MEIGKICCWKLECFLPDEKLSLSTVFVGYHSFFFSKSFLNFLQCFLGVACLIIFFPNIKPSFSPVFLKPTCFICRLFVQQKDYEKLRKRIWKAFSRKKIILPCIVLALSPSTIKTRRQHQKSKLQRNCRT